MRTIRISVVLLFVWPLVAVNSDSTNGNNNVQMTRTSIKVARNLDPDAMETLEVKTRTGDVATIVVKKRDGRQHFSGGPAAAAAADAATAAATDMQLVSSSSSEGGGGDGSATVSRLVPPEPVVIRSDSVYVKNNNQKGNEEDKKPRSLMHVDVDGIPVITGVVEPDDENDTQVWRNARVINGVLVPNTVDKTAEGSQQKQQQQHNTAVRQQPSNRPSPVQQQQQPQQQQQQPQQQQIAPMFNGVWQVYKKRPEVIGVKPDVDNDGPPHRFAALPPRGTYDEQYMTDKILGYIRDINGNVLSSGGDRMARSFDAQERPRMEARVLHAPSVSVFPNSAAYSSKPVSRLSFEESARTPVLQYAHPELGVQAAKYEPAAAPPVVVQVAAQHAMLGGLQEDAQRDGRRQQALSYFGHDIHADRSPFAFEPGLEKESRVKVPKKYSPHYYYNGGSGSGYPEKQGKYGGGGGAYYVNDDEASFWTLVKNKMRTSMDKVTDLTRPVVDPLMEATQKITGNLGFGSGNRELSNVVKEKLGMVATPSVLLPALGLVAGGAALGLGAVAVGRYLDYDVIRMRNNEDIIELQRALNGSYEPIIIQTDQLENKKSETETETEKQTEPIKRSRRSLSYYKGRPFTNRKIKKVRLTLKT